MRDFTIQQYTLLLDALIQTGAQFQTVQEYAMHPTPRSIVLRHDIDDRKEHALIFAQIQKNRGVKATYYFRMVPQSFDKTIIQAIAEMGHEIGYHYEDMDFAKGDPHEAYSLFQKHLKELREVAEVKTICMHGSPRSEFDNKDVWKIYPYKSHDIIAEPYLDFNFDQLFYITDTGRMWDGKKYSIRDEIKTSKIWPSYHYTSDIIQSAKSRTLPFPVMINFHPQRWSDSIFVWTQELVLQTIKNQIKRIKKNKAK